MTRLAATLHEDLCKFVKIFRSILLRMWTVLHKTCRGNQNKFYIQ